MNLTCFPSLRLKDTLREWGEWKVRFVRLENDRPRFQDAIITGLEGSELCKGLSGTNLVTDFLFGVASDFLGGAAGRSDES